MYILYICNYIGNSRSTNPIFVSMCCDINYFTDMESFHSIVPYTTFTQIMIFICRFVSTRSNMIFRNNV